MFEDVGTGQKIGRDEQNAAIAFLDPLLQSIMPVFSAKEVFVRQKYEVIFFRCFEASFNQAKKLFFERFVSRGIRQENLDAGLYFRYNFHRLIRAIARHFGISLFQTLLNVIFQKRLTERERFPLFYW